MLLKVNLQLHNPYVAMLVVCGDKRPSEFGGTVAFWNYFNGTISHILHEMTPMKCYISIEN